MIALVKNLASKEPYYIRCIKPNDQKSPVIFDEERVTHQVGFEKEADGNNFSIFY